MSTCAFSELALAFDVGTTGIACSLLELREGKRLARASAANPQSVYGTDVVSRLDAACRSGKDAERLSSLLRGALHDLSTEVLGAAGAKPESVKRTLVAGNPAMEHLLLGLPVRSLAFPPHRPLFTGGKVVPAADIGIPGGSAYLFPLPGGFVGGDLVAFLAAELRAAETSLFIDIGTNGEVALSSPGGILATSAAAGPALEGGGLSCGMAAVEGAVLECAVSSDRVSLAAAGGGRPQGLSGSAVIDLVAGLLREGVIDSRGRIVSAEEVPGLLGARVREGESGFDFVAYRDAAGELVLTQKDVRQVQLAKGALRAAVEVLLQRGGVEEGSLERVVITGSFGFRLNPHSLKRLGILSEKMVNNCAFVRDGALAGVEKAALDGSSIAEEMSAAVRVVPLSGTPLFEKHFFRNLDFPDTSAIEPQGA